MDESRIPCSQNCVVVGGAVTNLILSVHHTALQQNQHVAQQGFTLGTKLSKNGYCGCPHSGILQLQDGGDDDNTLQKKNNYNS